MRLISELDTADQRAKELAKGLTPLQVNWKPSQDAWSVGQCLEHLRVAPRGLPSGRSGTHQILPIRRCSRPISVSFLEVPRILTRSSRRTPGNHSERIIGITGQSLPITQGVPSLLA